VYSTNLGLLIYDGNCGMCSSSTTWITNRLKRPDTAEAVASQWLSEADLQGLGLSADDVKRCAWPNSSDYVDSGVRQLSVEGLFP
jgi:predicted DCC family thiol-disulfide oxidoreductase YuxK